MPRIKGFKHSKETKRKMSETMKKLFKENKVIIWNKGKKCPQISRNLEGRIPWNKGKKGLQTGWMKGKKFSEEHKKKISESHKGEKNWRWKGGAENKRLWTTNSRIKKRGNGGSHTLKEWNGLKYQYNYTCPSCKKKEPEIKLTEDHIIPISKGGNNNIENIQPLCKSCNCKKFNKTIYYKNAQEVYDER